jgi:glutamate N-acetyltransferase/amino-acid N-acetyltransferase
MPYKFPIGFQGAAVHCGLKRRKHAEDLSLIVSDRPAVAVGVYTRNLVCAAPVTFDRARTPSDAIRGVVVNSGNANACTGDQGLRDAARMAELMAEACGFESEQALVLSTGVIGAMLPMDTIARGIEMAAAKLADDQESLVAAARGMMTTDKVTKICTRSFDLDGVPVTVTGVAKGAAMIGPNMATMLAVVMTDANVRKEDAQPALVEAVDESFNCISVDGHTSTNDTVLLLANGAAGGPVLEGRSLAVFRATLLEVCEDLAQAIPADGEGATHLVTVEVHGCRCRKDAVRIAKTIADSPLVKTAIHGADPNWGRIVSAAGYAGVDFDPTQVTLLINGLLVYEHGVPVKFDAEEVSKSIRDNRDTGLVLILSEGADSARFWTTDLTAEYVRLNADYHT